ncbi:hypothetical protein DDZ16_14975 [Marinilabilia rubra]|uniref:Uncharacterized protein n=1 Tax=Marinilabilia rubra TaxID=2162893 RepID=A0A2U2B637_9BACT|nr:hypothetical protein DDZ16_14975 [Marinilabilia rubra]
MQEREPAKPSIIVSKNLIVLINLMIKNVGPRQEPGVFGSGLPRVIKICPLPTGRQAFRDKNNLPLFIYIKRSRRVTRFFSPSALVCNEGFFSSRL